MSLATINVRPESPEALASCTDWWPWLTDQTLRLKAAIAYRAWPNQNTDKTARGERYVAAAKAIGASERAAEYFRNNRGTLENAEKWAARAEWDEQLRIERLVREMDYDASPEGKRKLAAQARAAKRQARLDLQQVRQVWNTLTDTSFWVTANASWGFYETPCNSVLATFDMGTVEDFDDCDGALKLLTTRRAARKALAKDFVKHAGKLRFSPISKARGMWNFEKKSESECLSFAEKRYVGWATKVLK